jgi:predicted MFS family arabinose efflux permease
VFLCYMGANNAFYIFTDNYLSSRFGYGTLGTSMAMLVTGIALAFSSGFLVEPAQRRFNKQTILIATCLIMIGCSALFVLTSMPLVCFISIFVLFFCFGITYPILLGIYSASVGKDEQGWVMGITTSLFTLGAGVLSLADAGLMEISIRAPFYTTIGLGILTIAVSLSTWTMPEIKRITRKPEAPPRAAEMPA